MHRILIVDQDEHLLWALEKNLFPERDDFELVTASEGEVGMEHLKEGDVDLLICDIKMPGEVDGFQLILRAKEIAPDARVIIMTAFGAGRIESFAERMGITHYIEKPFNISDLREMALDLFDEREGFQGMLSDLELTDIIQMLCLSNRSTVLHLKHKDHRGKIVFDRGKLVHAEFDNEEGVEAVYGMLALSQGDIFMESGPEYDERTIEVGWQDLLLEAAKRADEARLAEQSGVEPDDGTPFASFRPSESAEIDLDEVSAAGAASSAAEVDAAEQSDPGGDEQLAGLSDEDSFFTEEELEEIGMASSAAIDNSDAFKGAGESTSSPKTDEAGDAGGAAESSEVSNESNDVSAESSEAIAQSTEALDESEGTDGHLREVSSADDEEDERVAGADAVDLGDSAASSEDDSDAASADPGEEADGSLGASDGDLVTDGGSRAASRERGDDAAGVARDDDGAGGILSEFAAECTGLQMTGLVDLRGDQPVLVESRQPDAVDIDGALEQIGEVVDCADRVAGAMKNGVGAGEIQLILPDSFVVMRRVGQGEGYHLAVVERDASLGVVLVLMRQFADQFADALAN
ncbi:MAG: DUF4388 domain-containing protein [Persicimonas sp.]